MSFKKIRGANYSREEKKAERARFSLSSGLIFEVFTVYPLVFWSLQLHRNGLKIDAVYIVAVAVLVKMLFRGVA